MTLKSPLQEPIQSVLGRRRLMGGSGAATYPAKTNYVADFSGAANGTALRTLSGWSNVSSTGVVADRLQIQSAQVAGGPSQNFTAPCGDTLVARDLGTPDHFIQLTLGAFVNGTDMQMVVAGTDEKNCIALQFSFGAVTTANFRVSKVVAGVETQLVQFTTSLNSTPMGRTPVAGDVVKLSTIGTKVFVSVAGVQLKSAGIDITGFTKGNKVGFGTFDLDAAQRFSGLIVGVHTGMATLDLDNATVWGYSDGFTNNWPAFWPGRIGVGASATLAGRAVGTVSDVDFRVRNAATGATVQDWTRVTSLSVASGGWSGRASLPMADTVTNPQYKIDARAANDIDGGGSNYQATTVGLAVLGYGQSNSENFTGTATVSTAVDYANAYACAPHSTNDPWWAGGTATGATDVRKAILWASKIAASVGIPVGVVCDGRASYSIAQLIASDAAPTDYNSASFWDNLLYDLSRGSCNAAGLIYAANFTQSESEADLSGSYQTSAGDRATYRANALTLIGLLRGAGVAVASNIPIGFTVIGQFAGDKAGDTSFANYNWSYQRETTFGLTDLAASTYISGSLMDLKHANTDVYHYVGESYVEAGRRIGMSMAKAIKDFLALGTYTGSDGRGPRVSSVTRSGAVITLNLTANGATGFDQTTAGNLDGYDVYLASDPNQGTGQFPTLLTKSSTVLDAANSKITITLSANPGAAVKVRSFYGHWPERDKAATPAVNAQDITAIRARGTYADGSKIAVEPIYSALTSN